MKRAASIATVFALCCTGVWILGEILSDQWGWSQWIAWIPTLALLIVVVCATSIAIISKSKLQSILCLPMRGLMSRYEGARRESANKT